MKTVGLQIIETYKKHLDIGLNVGSEGNISIRNRHKRFKGRANKYCEFRWYQK